MNAEMKMNEGRKGGWTREKMKEVRGKRGLEQACDARLSAQLRAGGEGGRGGRKQEGRKEENEDMPARAK
jgi:hypothetical protein